jgi:hypothetical protein
MAEPKVCIPSRKRVLCVPIKRALGEDLFNGELKSLFTGGDKDLAFNNIFDPILYTHVTHSRISY